MIVLGGGAVYVIDDALHCQDRNGNSQVYLDGSVAESVHYDIWADEIRACGARSVAMIGGGLCNLPLRLTELDLAWDIYELHDVLRVEMMTRYPEAGWRWIVGDYRVTFPTPGQSYDVIVFDADEALQQGISEHLNPNGFVLAYTGSADLRKREED